MTAFVLTHADKVGLICAAWAAWSFGGINLLRVLARRREAHDGR